MKTKACILLGLIGIACHGQAASATALKIWSPTNITTGTTFFAVVSVSNATDLTGFQLEVEFDHTRLELLNIVRGQFLGNPTNGVETRWVLPSVAGANTSGVLHNITCSRLASNGVTGGGALVGLQFRERAGGIAYETAFRFNPAATFLSDATPGYIHAELSGSLTRVLGDSDGDGVPDYWEILWLGSTNYHATDDPDGDHENLLAEYQHSTDPNNARSVYDATNRYNRFRFELFRNGMQTNDAPPDSATAWGVAFIAWPPEGMQFISGSLGCPVLNDQMRFIELDVDEAGGCASHSYTEYTSARNLALDFQAGVYYATLLTTVSGSDTQKLCFKINLPAYTETNFPPYLKVEQPAPFSNAVVRLPHIEFDATNWDYLVLNRPGEGTAYNAVNDSNADSHQVTNKLGGGMVYLLGVDRNDMGTTWLGSRTWLLFATEKAASFMSVYNAYGTPAPNSFYEIDNGAGFTNRVDMIASWRGTQYMCQGWTLAGNDPSESATNEVAMIITNQATLTWQWSPLAYWLQLGTNGSGTVSPAPGWQTTGAVVSISATPAQYFSFNQWTGDIPAQLMYSNPASIPMNQARSIVAQFAAALATNNVPLWWLARHGWTTDVDTAALGDQDGDHQFTWEEYVANTDPTNPASFFELDAVEPFSSAALRLRWQSQTERTYAVDEAEPLLPPLAWTPTLGGEDLVGDGNPMLFIPPMNADTTLLYRLRVRVTP